jgi:hypothetical protein
MKITEETDWIAIKDEVPMCTAEEYLRGGKHIIITDGSDVDEIQFADHGMLRYVVPEMTHWMPYTRSRFYELIKKYA